MNESEERLNTAAARKEKIRQRYRGINPDELDVIPALPQEDFYQGDSEKRVAVYLHNGKMEVIQTYEDRPSETLS